MADVSQIKLPNGSVYDLIDEKSGYITADYIENKTDYEIPVSRVGEIVVGETAIGTDSTNFPTSKAVVDYVDERVVQEIEAIDIPTVPTKTSDLTNDSGYLTASDIASVMTYKGTKANYAALPASGNTTGDVWHLTDTGAEWVWDGSAWQELGTAIDLSGYAIKATTLAGYGITDAKIQNGTITLGNNSITPLTSFTETDPTVPSWAKASSKPSYGLTEISGTDDLRAIESLTSTSGLLKKTAANTWTLDTNTYLTSYTETDPVFSASAAAGITATDISNWNAKVSDDKTWNGVTLNKEQAFGGNFYVPKVGTMTDTTAYYIYVTSSPSSGKIPHYDNSSYLYSTTPSANDNSTKVATTAYVDAAIPDTSGFVSKSGDTMTGNLTMSANKLIFSINNSANIVIKHGQGGMQAPILDVSAAENGSVYIRGVRTPSSTTDAANKQYVDDSIPKVYSSTNTGGYLTMATLPIYDGTVV